MSWDVFVSYCSKDKPVVRGLAERLKRDGLRVWFDEWEIKAGDSIPAKIEEGLERSRVLVLCMSAQAFGSDWARLESGTFRFRDSLNRERRFIPVRLDDAPAPGSLAQFKYVDWREGAREAEYPSLLGACRPAAPGSLSGPVEPESRAISLGHTGTVRSVALSPDGRRALSAGDDKTVRVWDLESSRCLKVLEGHAETVLSAVVCPDGKRALTGSGDKTVRLWNLESSLCLKVLEGHTGMVDSVAISANGKCVLSAGQDKTLRLWDLDTGLCLKVLEGHTDVVTSVAISAKGVRALSAGQDETIRLWDLGSSRCLVVFNGHVLSVAISPDGRHAVSSSGDRTVRLWDLDTGLCLKVLEGHTDSVLSVAITPDGKAALSGAYDKTLRLWDLASGRCRRILEGHTAQVTSVAISPDGKAALSGADDKTVRLWNLESSRCIEVLGGHTASVLSVATSQDGKRALSGAEDKTVRLWDIETGRCLKVLEGHTADVLSVAISQDGKRALSGAMDKTVRLWNIETGRCLKVLEGHTADVLSVAISQDGKRALSGAHDKTVRLWDIDTGRCLKVLEGHSDRVLSVAISQDGKRALSGAVDKTVRLWDIDTGCCLKVLEGHSAVVWSVAISQDGKRALSGAHDKTVRLWDIETGRCFKVLEGHTDGVLSVAISQDGKRALSGAGDKTVRLWDLELSRCLWVLEGHAARVWSVAWSPDGKWASSSAVNGVLRIWALALAGAAPVPSELPYTNAKVLLVGDSGVGKTGLARYLAEGIKDNEEKTSTDGAWATQWSLPHAKQDGVDREIWLWDFAGQVDYRLVHQLFMHDTAVVVLVFNPQNESLFDGLGQWDRDLGKAGRDKLVKLLAAGRVDRGGLVVTSDNVKRFMAERGFQGELHLTSAKTSEGCEKLRDAVVGSIDWDSLAVTSSPGLYRRMKEEILRLRDSGLVLLRMAELKQRMELALAGEGFDFKQLETVVGLLAGPGMIGRVGFGDFVLLRPEVLSRYASALVRRVRGHPQEMGCITEDDLLNGNLDYQDFQRLPRGDEAVILRHLHETLIGRAFCLRQVCDGTNTLVFPSYFRRERPGLPGHPSIVVSYRFAGPVDEIYATLVVRLHHTLAFDTDQLWKSAADFKTQTGQKLGILLTREAEGRSRLDAYFATDVGEDSRVLFLRYVHDHLQSNAQNVERLRHYACANKKCESRGQPFADRTKIDKALAPGGKGKVFCPDCGKPILLRDSVEKKFESPEVKEEARKQEDGSRFRIDNESRELILVGHAYAIAGEAGQIYRGYTDSDHGIDGEIEFKDDQGRASGERLYLQLKSGDSYLTTRKRDDAEVFQIKNPRWATYWQEQAYPVMLVIRTSNGEIRWMDVSTYLRREGSALTQIVFEGERLTAASLRRLRDRILGQG